MKKVKWFFADENENVLAETVKGIFEEEKAIDELSLMVPRGKYIFGYFLSDGKIKEVSKQIV